MLVVIDCIGMEMEVLVPLSLFLLFSSSSFLGFRMSCFVLSMLEHVDAGRPKYFLSALYIMRGLVYVDIYTSLVFLPSVAFYPGIIIYEVKFVCIFLRCAGMHTYVNV